MDFFEPSEHKNTERILKEAREYNESIVNTVREPLIVLDAKLRVISANKSFYNSFKVTPKKTVGHLIYDLGNRQWNIPKLRKLLEEILPNNTAFDNYEVEHDFPHIGRRTMLLNARRIPRPPAKPRIILLAIEDITNKRMTQKALDESGEKFRQFFESGNDAIFIATPVTRRLVDCNKKAEKLVRRSKTEILSMTADELHPKDKVKETMKGFKKQVEGKRGLVETEILTKTGKRIPVEINASIVQILGKKYLLGIFRDITERKKMKEKIEDATKGFLRQSKEIEKLKSVDIMKDEFLNLMTHELRTPLTSILGMTEILLSKKLGGLTNEQSKSLNIALNESRNLKKIINRILTVVRLEKGKMELEVGPFDISNIIKATMESMKTEADERDIKITLQVSEKLPLVKADKDQVVEVLDNLIDNAIKFSPRKNEITVSAEVKGKHVLIKVKDSGIGIDKKSKPHIFEKFYQSDMSISKKHGGTGLGLYACKLIVQKMNGEIGFTSNVGKGSTFYFSLPIFKTKRRGV